MAREKTNARDTAQATLREPRTSAPVASPPAPGSNPKPSEATAWAAVQQLATSSFNFWNSFLALRMGEPKIALDKAARGRLMCIIRAVSWQESRHGTGSGETARIDPMQCGNPADSWWRELIGPLDTGDRLIGGPGARNWYPSTLRAALENHAPFPTEARISRLQNPDAGHRNANFNQTMSYHWGVPLLIHKTNMALGGGKTYDCGDCSFERLIRGAVNYNGGGVPNYEDGIRAALALSGCYPAP